MEWIVLAAAIALGVNAFAWFAQDRLIYFPQPLASTAHLPPGAQSIEIASGDGTRLRGWLREGGTAPAPLLLYFGGNAEEVSWTLADARWPRDWHVAAVNYRGYGASEGRPAESALLDDALAIHDTLAARPDVDARRIVAVGRSLGTGLAARLAATRPIAGAILISQYDSLVELGSTQYTWLPVSWLLRHRFDASADARAARTPMLAIVGTADTIIPLQRSLALFDAWAGTGTWLAVPGADHDSLGDAPSAWDAMSAFLADRARSSIAP
ncbi:MAG TPA: alpha/beta hydrolase [Burkholderiaceae bacterium]|nr:alpha/beta hydrolase [Burkholderiaceae bacterium]